MKLYVRQTEWDAFVEICGQAWVEINCELVEKIPKSSVVDTVIKCIRDRETKFVLDCIASK